MNVGGDDQTERQDTQRLEAFSDGVLAIAVTLLVLNVKVAPHGGTLATRLGQTLPSIAAYAASFVLVGIVWANHHALFRLIERVDPPLLIFNLLVLLTVGFLPVPTALIATAGRAPADQRTAALLYAGTLLLMGLAFNALWWYAKTHRLTVPNLDPKAARDLQTRYIAGPCLYVLAGALAFIEPRLTLIVIVFVSLVFALGPVGRTRPAPPTTLSNRS